MNESSDPIAHIRSLADENRNTEAELRATLKTMAEHLVDACNGIDVSAWSEDCTLSECPPTGEWTRGHFGFGTEGIVVIHQSNDDIEDEFYNPDEFGPRYHGISIEECPISWLRTLLENECLEDFMSKIAKSISDQTELLRLRRDGVHAIAKTPSLAVSSSFERAAEELGYSRIVEQWRDAQNQISIAPGDAITRASSLLEAVATHILADLKVELPSDRSIQPLVKAAARALDLDPAVQADPELRGLCGAVGTIAQNVGVLRTKWGTAHGRGPEHIDLTLTHARLAVNTSGSVATFLMERWLARKEETSDT